MCSGKWVYIAWTFLLAIYIASCFRKTDKFQDSLRRAVQFEKKQDYRKALEEIDKAISLDSTNSFTFLFRGRINSLQGKDRLAIKDFTKAIDLNSENTAAYFYKAISYSLLDIEDSAIANYDAAIQTKTVGNVYFENSDIGVSDVDNLMDVKLFTIRYFRGKAFYNEKRDSLALEDFQFSLSNGYNIPESQFYIGVIMISKGNRSEGCSYLSRSAQSGHKEGQEYLDKYCKE